MPMPIPLLAASSGTASSPTSFPGAGSSGNASLAYAPTTLAYDATGSAAVFAPAALGASPASLSVPVSATGTGSLSVRDARTRCY